jgi:hypothetical protein
MFNRCRIARRCTAPALSALLLTSSTFAADATRRWLIASDGIWSCESRWDASPVPNNGNGGLTYRAILDAAGPAYTVNLDAPVTLDALTLDSPAATLRVTNPLQVIAAPIDVRGGTLLLDGGTVRGGSVTFAGAGSLVISAAQENRFTDGAIVHGDVNLSRFGARVLFQNGAWFTGDARFTGTGATIIGVAHDRSLDTGQTVHLDAPGSIFSIEGGSTLTIAAGAVVRGQGLIYNGTMGGGPVGRPTLVNFGRISADIPGGELRANPDTFINHGLIEATSGARLNFFAGVHNDIGGRLRAAGGANLRIDGLAGTLNDTTIEGTGTVMRLNGAGFTVNRDVSVPRDTMLVLGGTWTLNAALDVGGRVVVDHLPGASPIEEVRAELLAGRNGGTWDGPTGIRSSDASVASGTALGYIASAEMFPLGGTWGGEHVDESAVLIAHVRLGDANLDGTVSLDDFNRLAQHFGSISGADWSAGDFDYNGRVDLIDFNLLAANFGLRAAGSQVTPQDWSALSAVVPEPGLCAAILVLPFLTRCRGRKLGWLN